MTRIQSALVWALAILATALAARMAGAGGGLATGLVLMLCVLATISIGRRTARHEGDKPCR